MKYVLIATLLLATVVLGMPIGKDNDEEQAGSKNSTMQSYLGGEHSPLIFTCPAETLDHNAGTDVTTQWLQLGWVPILGDNDDNNVIAQRYSPRIFTVIVELDTIKTGSIDGDSLGLRGMRFEMTWDTTASPIWLSDSSNVFMLSTHYTHSQYGIWRWLNYPKAVLATYEDLPKAFMIRVPFGAFIRFVGYAYYENYDGAGGNGMTEKTKLNITLICNY